MMRNLLVGLVACLLAVSLALALPPTPVLNLPNPDALDPAWESKWYDLTAKLEALRIQKNTFASRPAAGPKSALFWCTNCSDADCTTGGGTVQCIQRTNDTGTAWETVTCDVPANCSKMGVTGIACGAYRSKTLSSAGGRDIGILVNDDDQARVLLSPDSGIYSDPSMRLKRNAFVSQDDFYFITELGQPITGMRFTVLTAGTTAGTQPLKFPTVWQPETAYLAGALVTRGYGTSLDAFGITKKAIHKANGNCTSGSTTPAWSVIACTGGPNVQGTCAATRTCSEALGGTCFGGSTPTTSDGTCTWTLTNPFVEFGGGPTSLASIPITDGTAVLAFDWQSGDGGWSVATPDAYARMGITTGNGPALRIAPGDNGGPAILVNSPYTDGESGRESTALTVANFGDARREYGSVMLGPQGVAAMLHHFTRTVNSEHHPIYKPVATFISDANGTWGAGARSFTAAYAETMTGGRTVTGPYQTSASCASPPCRLEISYPYGVCSNNTTLACSIDATCGAGTCIYRPSSSGGGGYHVLLYTGTPDYTFLMDRLFSPTDKAILPDDPGETEGRNIFNTVGYQFFQTKDPMSLGDVGTWSNTQQTITAADPATEIFTLTAHGYPNLSGPYSIAGSTLPAGVSTSRAYWLIVTDANHFKLSLSPTQAAAGTAVNITTTGTAGNWKIGAANCVGQLFRPPAGVGTFRQSHYRLTGTGCDANCFRCAVNQGGAVATADLVHSAACGLFSAATPPWRYDYKPFCDANNNRYERAGFSGASTYEGSIGGQGVGGQCSKINWTTWIGFGEIPRSGTCDGMPTIFPNLIVAKPPCTCVSPPDGTLGESWSDTQVNHVETCTQISSGICAWSSTNTLDVPLTTARKLTQVASIMTPVALTTAVTDQLFRLTCYETVTQAASTSGGVLPNCNLVCQDATDSQVKTITVAFSDVNSAPSTPTSNYGITGTGMCDAKAGSTISFSTTVYDPGVGTPMQYKIYVKLEALS